MRPNIVFITVHDLGRHLPCYGWESVPAPNMDRLATEGVVFEQGFCTPPQCSPSRAALHTGRHAHATGMHGLAHAPFFFSLHDDEIHMAQRLQAVGYSTTLIGVQHVAMNLSAPDNPARLGYDTAYPWGDAITVGSKAAQIIAERANGNKPFYLEVGLIEPHRPYDNVPPNDRKGVDLPPYVPNTPEARHEFAMLQGTIKRMDDGVGLILDALDAHGLTANTWLIFVTDHGLAMPRAKCMLYDPGIETALLMRWPTQGISGGKRVSSLVSHVDMVPTMLDALNMPQPDNLHGKSYWSLLTGDVSPSRDRVYAEKSYHGRYDPIRAVRTETHKLIVNFEIADRIDVPTDTMEGQIFIQMLDEVRGKRPQLELYDLRVDPDEKQNIANQPESAEIVAALKADLVRWMRETGDPLLNGPIASPYNVKAIRVLEGATE